MVLGVLAGCWLGFLLIRQGGDVLRLRAIVVRKSSKSKNDLEKRAALLRQDSINGLFKGTIRVLHETDTLVANGNPIRIINSDKPEDINYDYYDLIHPLIIDNTGIWSDRDNLKRYLGRGAKKVLLTAPAAGDIPNFVYGVNHHQIDPQQDIISAACFTTNAIVPVLITILDKYGIEQGHVETMHAYTQCFNGDFKFTVVSGSYQRRTQRIFAIYGAS